MHGQRGHTLPVSVLVCTSPGQCSGSQDAGMPGDALTALTQPSCQGCATALKQLTMDQGVAN